MFHGTHRLTGALAAVLALASVAWVSSPASAEASTLASDSQHATLWGGRSTQTTCVNLGSVRERHAIQWAALASAAPRPPGEAAGASTASPETSPTDASPPSEPCDSGGDDVAGGNLCLDGPEAPTSISPEAWAEKLAVDRSARIMDVARSVLGADTDDTPPEATFVSGLALKVPLPAPPPGPNVCTVEHPQQCQRRPPLPSQLQIEVLPSIAQLKPSIWNQDAPVSLQRSDAIPRRLRVRPSRGYDSPPDKPPRLT